MKLFVLIVLAIISIIAAIGSVGEEKNMQVQRNCVALALASVICITIIILWG